MCDYELVIWIDIPKVVVDYQRSRNESSLYELLKH